MPTPHGTPPQPPNNPPPGALEADGILAILGPVVARNAIPQRWSAASAAAASYATAAQAAATAATANPSVSAWYNLSASLWRNASVNWKSAAAMLKKLPMT